MSKIEKKLKKSLPSTESVLIVGQGFIGLDTALEVFNTVFVVNSKPLIKNKKLIHITSTSGLSIISNLSVIMFDRSQIDNISSISSLWHRNKPLIIIEGNEVISRDYSGSLYQNNYRAIEQTDTYHIWKSLK